MPVKITPAGGCAFRMKNQAANLGRVALDLIKTHHVNAPTVAENALRTVMVGFNHANNLSPLL